ncbi:MAG: bis(5'-nucleosyl)-tetraphosphatase (symmetrical) YqeK [Clostridiales bacterium]|nr:bis(5'-nucleosyl)-tetraphosphatase (symmetrical) YqeK [Clostridiales bacterium]
MRIGLFGGSFDPVHKGHVSIVNGALRSGLVDIVIVIPAVINSFKQGKILLPAPYRYYMAKDVFESGNVFVSDIEYKIEGVSYTAKTLELLTDRDHIVPFLEEKGIKAKKAKEEHSYFWICGSDILPSFMSWYKPEVVLSYVTLLVAKRPGSAFTVPEELKDHIIPFDIEEIEAASSDIRRKGDLENVPESAVDFIRLHNLYELPNPLDQVSEQAYVNFCECAVRMYFILGRKRLLHTLNVGILSCKLAGIFGVDVDKALIAGAVHDCAKELPIKVQQELAYKVSGDTFTDEKLLHSPAGAYYAKEHFGIDDQEILDAVTYHTTGKGDMTDLEKIVFLADKIEPSRNYTDLSEIRAVSLKDLDKATAMCVKAVKAKFESKNRPIHPLTSAFMEQLGI